ncbi:hypothetical protein [Tenacibaculum caenipelagi]|uniref:Uncharacterized protein n=1 Tax=Tenacibaculum caenipelagi TaxID=1325435 RepID=A0A4V3D339_9FLAO|nr:hypothetical protein [Tenacibaculum caenipelagi]TDQ27674.1 hypothetical protein DFQ07_1525 [Tenacibaculum caenipelagi]
MNYPINLLKTTLREAEDAQLLCIKSYNKEDYKKIQKEVVTPLKTTIKLIEMAVENKINYPDRIEDYE